jgi:hypothetical protein
MLKPMASPSDPSTPRRPGPPVAVRRRWRGPLAGLVTILAIAVPTMIVAEDWGGHPMIDDAGSWWMVPAVLAVGAFFVGGAVSVRRLDHLRLHWRALRAAGVGIAVGAVAAGILVAADGVRRLLVNPTLPPGVVHYWVEAVVVAVVACLAGAVAAVVSARPPGSM